MAGINVEHKPLVMSEVLGQVNANLAADLVVEQLQSAADAGQAVAAGEEKYVLTARASVALPELSAPYEEKPRSELVDLTDAAADAVLDDGVAALSLTDPGAGIHAEADVQGEEVEAEDEDQEDDQEGEPEEENEGEDGNQVEPRMTVDQVLKYIKNNVDLKPYDSMDLRSWDEGQSIFSNWTNGSGGRRSYQWFLNDYTNSGFRQLYAEKLYKRRYEIMKEVFDSDCFVLPDKTTTIASIGSGPGAELLAAYHHFQMSIKLIKFLAVDRARGWRSYFEVPGFDQFNFMCMDMSEFDAMATLMAEQSTSCVIISHVLVDFQIDGIITKLFTHEQLRKSLRCVIVLDRYKEWNDKPQAPADITVTRVFNNDTALIYTKVDVEDSLSRALEQTHIA